MGLKLLAYAVQVEAHSVIPWSHLHLVAFHIISRDLIESRKERRYPLPKPPFKTAVFTIKVMIQEDTMFQLLVIIYLAFISLGLPDALLGSAWPSMYRNWTQRYPMQESSV